jgi:hypothetical protein
MTLKDLYNAIEFLQKVYVGQGDQERLFQTLAALNKEIDRRTKK